MSRAVRIHEFGGPEVLTVEAVERPEAGPGRVVVEVAASSINPGEAMLREGGSTSSEDDLPMGEGSDLAGRVTEVGAGVDAWSEGDEVIGWTDERGAHAEFVSVPAEQLVARPEGVSSDQGGSLYVAGGTAHAMADAARVSEGDAVAVAGATGGVGSILVQLLRARGVRVLGIAGPANDEWLRSVGAEPVNYGDDLEHRLREAAPDGLTAMLDAFGGGYVETAAALGLPSARIITIIDFEAAQRGDATLVFGHEHTTADVIAELARLVASGDLEIPIAATFPLDQVRSAFERLADRHTRGKIVLHP